MEPYALLFSLVSHYTVQLQRAYPELLLMLLNTAGSSEKVDIYQQSNSFSDLLTMSLIGAKGNTFL